MKIRCLIFFIAFLAVITSLVYANLGIKKVATNGDYVPDKETAIKIAEAIWYPIYGKKIYEEKPFVARLENPGVWIVEGTLKEYEVGGVAYIEIQRKDCKILKVTHGK